MKSFLLLAGAVLVFSGCKKTPVAQQELEDKLLGKWQFRGAEGGLTGKYEVVRPDVNFVLEFNPKYHFVKTLNGKVTEEGPYDLITTKSIHTGKDDNAIRFNVTDTTPYNGEIISISNDTLSIANNTYDGYGATYVRIK